MPATKYLVTVATGSHRAFLDVTRPVLEDYASRHGYELVVPEEDPAPERTNKQWGKIACIRGLLPSCELLFWIDADAVIVDPTADIADALPRRRFLGLVEHHFLGQSVPNTGVMVVRSGRRADRFFEELWGKTAYLEHKWGDNAAVLELLGYDFDADAVPLACARARPTAWRRRVHFLDLAWNAMPVDMAPQPHIVHFTGAFSHEERLERLRAAVT